MEQSEMRPLETTLQMEDEIDLHKTGWVIQRAGWVLLYVIVIAAALGFFGDGWLSRTSTSGENVVISYERFIRTENPTRVHFNTTANDGEMILSLPGHYVDIMHIRHIQPEPRSQEIHGDRLALTFTATGSASVILTLSPQRRGSLQGEILVNDESVLLSHYVYP